MSLTILDKFREQASKRGRHILLADAEDERMIVAARIATNGGIARISLVGPKDSILRRANQTNISLDDIGIIDPEQFDESEKLIASYRQTHHSKPLSLFELKEGLHTNPLFFAAVLTQANMADGVLAGSLSTTGDVIRAALRGIGLKEGSSVLSSMFLMHFPALKCGADFEREELLLGFGDCAVVPDPDSAQLADIAISTAQTFFAITQQNPKVAMLSFSTKGSADTVSTAKVVEATKLARTKMPDLIIDGELQFDAAFVPQIARIKAPESIVAGNANVFIFPNLDAGNIGYKIAERLGAGRAIGPILQGLAKPMNDLSRGAIVSDIVDMIAITALQE